MILRESRIVWIFERDVSARLFLVKCDFLPALVTNSFEQVGGSDYVETGLPGRGGAQALGGSHRNDQPAGWNVAFSACLESVLAFHLSRFASA